MNKDDYIKKYNLVATRSVERFEDVLYSDCSLASITYSNCINVYELIEKFNKLYLNFKNDFNKLFQLDLLSEYHLTSYYETSHFKSLIYSNREAMLNFLSIGNHCKLIKSNLCDLDNKTNLNIDENIVKSYLEFGNKYQEVINEYNVICNMLSELNINNGIVLSLEFNSDNINELDTIMYSFGLYNTNFRLTYKLGEKLTLLNVSNASLYDYSESDIENIAKNIYIDESYLCGLDAFKSEKKKILEK